MLNYLKATTLASIGSLVEQQESALLTSGALPNDLPNKKTGDDLVTLPEFADMIADPKLIYDLMIQQGVENVDFVEPTSPMSGGTSDNNYKGYIHWLDGTKTKVIIKGSRSGEKPPTSYRESLFYSR